MTEVRNQVLAKLDRADLRVYLVWVPMMGADAASADRAAERITDPRVQQFWDQEGAVGSAFGRALAIPGRANEEYGFGWDLYLLYKPGEEWSDPAPKPSYAQVGLMAVAPREGVEAFDGSVLREHIARIPID